VIKSITRSERKYFIKKMLKYYYQRIAAYPHSKLSRILGIYEFHDRNTTILLMENILPNKNLAYIFDLKGSTYNRSVLSNSAVIKKGVTMKDMDLKMLNFYLDIDEDTIRTIKNSIQDDVRFLEEAGIMDYSLLLGVYENFSDAANRYTVYSTDSIVYNIGIIDFMQEFNLAKKAEREMKKVISGKDISSVNPHRYAERFLSFVDESVLSCSAINKDSMIACSLKD
jgi:hypothetical protein